MKKQITRRDLEAISAYLDGELRGRDQVRLETRLQRETDLRQALEAMRQTRSLLREAPRLRAPRNFTLTPEMVGIRPASTRTRLFPALSLASALATFLLVAVLVGDMLGAFPQPAATTALRAMETEVAVAEMAAEPEQEMAAPAGAAEATIALEAAPAAVQTLEVEEALDAEATSMTKVGEVITQAQTDLEGGPLTPPPSETPSPVLQLAEPGGEGEVTVEALPQILATMPPDPTPEPSPPPQAIEAPPEPSGGFSTLLVVELGLAILAVTTGMAAIVLRRRARA